MKIKPTIVAIMGPSAGGKDTLARSLVSTLQVKKRYGYITNSSHLIVSDTTRPPRENEKDGIDYNFVDSKEFLRRNVAHEYIETYVYGPQRWRYGTPRSQFGTEINVGVFSPSGVDALYRNMRDGYDIFVVYIDDYLPRRLLRSIKRDGKLSFEHIRRAWNDRADFKDIVRKMRDKGYTVINCSHEKTLDKRRTVVYNMLCGFKKITTT